MKSFIRAAAIAAASTALVAGGATAATAAPATTAQGSSVVALSSAPTVSVAADVSTAVAPYPLDYKSKIRIKKVGKKLTFRFTARFRDDAGTPVGIRKVTLQVKKNHKWKTVKRVTLKTNGTGTYKRSDKKKRNYRMVIDATPLYQGGIAVVRQKI